MTAKSSRTIEHAPNIDAALVAKLRQRAAEAEIARNVSLDSIVDLQDVGAFRVWQARKHGGAQSTIRAHLDTVSTIAEGCVSTAWVCGVYHAHTWIIAHFPEAAQHDVFGKNEATLTSAVITPRGRAQQQADGSYILDGVWPFCSGVGAAQWVVLGAEMFSSAGIKQGDGELLIPTGDIEILNDWRTCGLAGTGSHTVRARSVRVPHHRTLSMPALLSGETQARAVHGDGLYLSPAVPVLTIALTGASIGAARAALKDYISSVAGKAVAYTSYIADQWPVRQYQVGLSAARIEAATLLLYRCADAIDNAAKNGGEMSEVDRARARMDCAQAVRFCMEAIDGLWLASGGGGVALAAPLQRAARDLHAINNHGLLALDINAELYGAILSHQPANTPLL